MLRSLRVTSPVLLVVTSAFALSHTARADDQTTQPQTAAMLQEVVVTAQKRQEKVLDVPMAVTAITADAMQSQKLMDFADLETQVPGLSVELTAPGLDRLTLRGENVGGVGSTVGTYIDDVPFGSSNALANGEGTTGDFDTWDLQRVEVLRGPQGTLYGAGSEGGLLKYVTNPPDPTQFSSAFELGDAEVANGGTGADYKAMVNLPMGGISALRLDGFYTQLPGYIDDPQLGEKDINRGYQEGGRASFLVNVTDNFSIRLSAFGQTLHTDGSPEVDVIGSAGTPVTPPADQLQPDIGNYDQARYFGEPATFKYQIYSAKLQWNLGWGTLTSISGYGTTTQDQYLDSTWVAAAPEVSFGEVTESVLPAGTTAAVAETDDLNIKKVTQEVRLESSKDQPLEWITGVFYTRESSTIAQTLPTFIFPGLATTGLPSLENANLDAIYREYSGYGQIDYHFNPAFDVALGARWSENKQSTDQLTSGLLVSTSEATGVSTGNDFLYSIAPRWHLSRNTMAYARVATGYRPGGPNALPPLTTGTAGVPTSYKSDSTVNYEVGLKSIMLDNRLSVDVDAFLVQWKDIQLFEYVDSFGINANGGTATSKGLEWTFAFTPVEGLNFAFDGAYIDADLTADAPATGGLDGNQLPYAPKWTDSLDASYTWRAFQGFHAFAGATWSYIGARQSDFGATAAVVNNAVVFERDPPATLGGYNTVNLRTGLDNGRWSFELYCKNLANSRGIAYYTSQGTPNFGGAITLQQPRTIGVTIDLHL